MINWIEIQIQIPDTNINTEANTNINPYTNTNINTDIFLKAGHLFNLIEIQTQIKEQILMQIQIPKQIQIAISKVVK